MAERKTKTAPAKPKTAPRQRKSPGRDDKFVDLVAKGKAPSEAYVEAGFNKTKNASVLANRKLKQGKIQTLLDKRKAHFRSIADVEALDIIGAQAEIAFGSIEDALDNRGILDFAKAKKNGSAKLIKKISRSQTQYGESVVVEFYSRTDALGQLSDILGLKQAPKQNEADRALLDLKSKIDTRAKEKGVSYTEELQYVMQNHSEAILPEIAQRLTSELVQ